MLERFLEQTTFTSQEDFIKHFKVKVPENFNFGYDVVDAWAAENPGEESNFMDKRQGRAYPVYLCRLKTVYRYDCFLFSAYGHRTR